MPTYINIAPNTSIPKEYVFCGNRTYIIPYTSLSSISLRNRISLVDDINIIEYVHSFLRITHEIMGNNVSIFDSVLVDGFDSKKAHYTMQYVCYEAIKKCTKAILFMNNNDYMNSDIYHDIEQIYNSGQYGEVIIVDEDNKIYNITEPYKLIGYKYRQYIKEREEICNLIKRQ